MKKSLLAAAVAATLGLAGASAQALTLYYDAYGGFVKPPPPDGMANWGDTVEYGGYEAPGGIFGQVAWGIPTETGGDYAGKSYMEINGNDRYKYAPGDILPTPQPRLSVETGASDYRIFGDLTHINYPIALAGDGKGWVNVNYVLDLYATADADEANKLYSLDLGPFILDIWETLNEGTNPSTCASNTGGSGLGGNTFAPNTSPQSNCDDAHAFGPASGTTPVASFSGYNVYVEGFFDAPVNGNLTSTFWSGEEGQSPTGYVGFRIETVPEPGSMALLGLGLAGLGLIRRRRSQA